MTVNYCVPINRLIIKASFPILRPRDARVLNMASPQQKAFCVIQFDKIDPVTSVQRKFRKRKTA